MFLCVLCVFILCVCVLCVMCCELLYDVFVFVSCVVFECVCVCIVCFMCAECIRCHVLRLVVRFVFVVSVLCSPMLVCGV